MISRYQIRGHLASPISANGARPFSTFPAWVAGPAELAEQAPGAADPDAVALALVGRAVGVVGQDFGDLGAGEVGLVAGEVEFGELDFGARVRMALGDLLPQGQGGQRLSQGHCDAPREGTQPTWPPV